MRKRFGLVLTVFAVVSSLFAQETTAGFQGSVKDPGGALIPNATIEVSGPALIGTRKAQSDGGGNYRFAALPPGQYSMTVTAAGFRTYKQTGIDLTVGRLPNIDVQLQVGVVTETVLVSSQAPIVDTTQSKVAVTVERRVLEDIPKGRSFQSVIPFAPGARQEPLQGGRDNRDNGFQIDGASDSENVYLIDGVNTTDIQNGGVGKSFQMDFIEEVQIKSSSFEAEYGGALGGVINAVPKRGSNDWHGELKSYFQASGLNANDPCASGFTASQNATINRVFGFQQPAGFAGVTCGLRLNPATALNSSARQDGTPEFYIPQKDRRHIIEPGYEVGGPILRDRLW